MMWVPGVVAVLVAGEAQAQHRSIHAGGAVGVGWTDNVSSVPSEPAAGEAPPRGALFTQIRPSVLFTFESPRTVHETSLELNLMAYQDGDPPTAYNITFAHDSLFSLGRASELGLSGAMSTGRVSAVLGEAGGDVPEAAPSGASTFIGGNATEVVRWRLARSWRLEQTATYAQVNTAVTSASGVLTGETVSRTAGVGLGIERSWIRTALSLTGGLGYIGITEIRRPDEDVTCSVVSTAALGLRRDLGESWSTSAELGLTALDTFQAARVEAEGSTVAPVGRLALTYFQPLGRATGMLALSGRRAIQPNLLLGTTTMATVVALSASLPLPWFLRVDTPTVRLRTTVGRGYSEMVDVGFIEPPSWHVDTVDVALEWSPYEAVSVALRYQYLDSVVPEDARMSAELADIRIPDDFTRTTVLVEVSGRWPSRPAAIMPDRRVLRVDRKNEQPAEEKRPARPTEP